MWDTAEPVQPQLSHDLPCSRCGHPMHTFLACSETCECEPAIMPGSVPLAV